MVMTLGETVDDMVRRFAREMNQSTEEAAEFIIWRVNKFNHEATPEES